MAITTSRANASPIHDCKATKSRATKAERTVRIGRIRIRTVSYVHRLKRTVGPRTGLESHATKRHRPGDGMNVTVCGPLGSAAGRLHCGSPFRVIFKRVFHVRLITPKYPTSACGPSSEADWDATKVSRGPRGGPRRRGRDRVRGLRPRSPSKPIQSRIESESARDGDGTATHRGRGADLGPR